MFQLVSKQHYQHRTNQKLRSWANAVFQNRGVCGQAFPSFPSPSPVIPFCFALVPTFLDELARKRLLRRLCIPRQYTMYTCPSTDVIQFALTLKMTTAQVVETSVIVNDNSPVQDYVHPGDQSQPNLKVIFLLNALVKSL